MISMATGRMPAAIVAATASPAASRLGYAASTVRVSSGSGSSRRVTSRAIPKRPSEPTNPPSQSGPAGSALPVPRRTTSPSGRTASIASTWLLVIPCLRQCAPPELKAMLPPIVHTDWLEGSGA